MMVPVKIRKINYLFLIVSLLVLCLYGISQEPETHQFIDTAYRQQPCLYNNEGNWHYEDDTISFTIKLRVYKKVYSPFDKEFGDYLVGWYDYRKNKLKEGSLVEYNESYNPIKAYFEKGDSDNITMSDINGYCSKKDSSIALYLNRKKDNDVLRVFGSMTKLDSSHANIEFRYYDNFNINQERDYMVEFWKVFSFPKVITLKKVGEK